MESEFFSAVPVLKGRFSEKIAPKGRIGELITKTNRQYVVIVAEVVGRARGDRVELTRICGEAVRLLP